VLTKTKKAESEAKKPKNLILRLFRPNYAPKGSLVSFESTDGQDACIEISKTIRNAMLETDYQNAKALLAFQRSERFR
jgi:hypothetical protein